MTQGTDSNTISGTGEAGAARESICNVVLGTAGHIDHGKSVLVQALTGVHPDRLKEERLRGITIDLGFAPWEISSGLRVGIIDVPGHERFIKNMVAGATGIDFVILVVAADDGVMAQTREHLDIIRLLDIQDGLVAVTKIDMADPEFVELVKEEVAELTVGTCLQGKPILPISAKTGEGMAVFKATLEQALSSVRRKQSDGPFRMPIQRVFAKEGFGTVTTGVPVCGSLGLGDSVEITPLGVRGRVKGLHAYQRKIERAHAGHSTAINISGIERSTVVRGMVATAPGIFQPSNLFTAHFNHLASSPLPLKHRAPIRFHAGTIEVLGRVHLLEGDRMAPGQSGFLQILLDEPTVLCAGDRYILRHQSPPITIGGGRILDQQATKRKRMNERVVQELQARTETLGDNEAFLACTLEYSEEPLELGYMMALVGLLEQQVMDVMMTLDKRGQVKVLKDREAFMGTPLLAKTTAAVRGIMSAFFKAHSALGFMERLELKSALEKAGDTRWVQADGRFDALLSLLEREQVIQCKANTVALMGRVRKLDEHLAGVAKKVESLVLDGGLTPPDREKIAAELDVSPKIIREVLRYLVETDRLVEATSALYFGKEVFEECVTKVRAMYERQSEWTTSDIRKELAMSRKFAIPLVECLDAKGITRRVGDTRVLVG